MRDVASAIISHEQTQSNRVCCFQTLDAVFLKDLLSDYILKIVHENIKSEMRSFKSNENIHKKEGGSYYVVSANKASSVTL